MDKGRGPLATVILKEGTLRIGDYIEADKVVGKTKSLVDSFGKQLKEVLPSIPVEVSGFEEIPPAGSLIRIISSREARNKLSDQQKTPLEQAAKPLPSLDEIIKRKEQENKTVDIILKSDSVGSLEALSQSILKLSYEGITPTILHKDVGGINSSDVNLAYASRAIIVGFNVRPDPLANNLIEELNIPVKLYRIIYQALEDIENLLKGAVVKVEVEKVIGKARIQALFKVSKLGMVAGCLVISGKAMRNSLVRVIRDGIVLREGKIASLRRFKDDAKEVPAGVECGIRLEGYQDFFENDEIEFYIKE
ncbi:MAG: Translation initiation factor IF-2 [candidate division WS2 bacterium]|nr:Translation initiation factor IF-2 [Candidatus Lithacetigena glycinireducens]